MEQNKLKQFMINLIIISVITCCGYFLYQSVFQPQIKPSTEQYTTSRKTSCMSDLQERVATLFIRESIAAAILISEMDLISYYIQKTDVNISEPTREILKNCLAHLKSCQLHLKAINMDKIQQLKKTAFAKRCVSINSSQVCLVDPVEIFQWICTEKQQLYNQYLKKTYVHQSVELSDWHNFLIYYTHLRLAHLMNQPISIEPPVISAHPIARQLIEIFKQKYYFQDLDIFLQHNGFRNLPQIRGWIFTAIYFDYVSMAYVNGYINMALRDFLMDIENEPLMINAFPEITPLKNYLILLQRYKLIK